jgi:hypothetical protein
VSRKTQVFNFFCPNKTQILVFKISYYLISPLGISTQKQRKYSYVEKTLGGQLSPLNLPQVTQDQGLVT